MYLDILYVPRHWRMFDIDLYWVSWLILVLAMFISWKFEIFLTWYLSVLLFRRWISDMLHVVARNHMLIAIHLEEIFYVQLTDIDSAFTLRSSISIDDEPDNSWYWQLEEWHGIWFIRTNSKCEVKIISFSMTNSWIMHKVVFFLTYRMILLHLLIAVDIDCVACMCRIVSKTRAHNNCICDCQPCHWYIWW
jgi:hypothetical protein